WDSLGKRVRGLLGRCLREAPADRPANFREILEILESLSPRQVVEILPEEDAGIVTPVAVPAPPVRPVTPVVAEVVPPPRRQRRARILEEDAANGRLITDLAPEPVFRLLCEAFVDFGVVGVSTDRQGLKVTGTTGMSWVSFGQQVTGSVFPCSEGTQVAVSSQPSYQVFDWGRGKGEAQK